MNDPAAVMTVVGIAGSLRRRSFNRALLRAAVGLAPEGMRIDVFDLAPVPLYNADLDENYGGGPYPNAVAELRARVEAADALLMVTPEYNWGPSGVTKNVVDWLSRPAGSSPLANKPIALAGASPGPAGTGRAQLQLRQHLLSTQSYVLQQPIVQLGGAAGLFDDNLELVDEAARGLVRRQLVALVDWTARMKAPSLAEAQIRLG
ncbi:MAG TPA: NAD(P)H-dependent oxidoreductase [Actinomycetota bacterium]|jgi:chromate reductase